MMGKELEVKQGVDEIATQEVVGYIERIEKQAEVKPPTVVGGATSSTVTGTLVDDAAKKALGLAPKQQKQQIVLPLTEEEVVEGLHHKVLEAIRWLAEWSIYMIKKYPGRVFYSARRNQTPP